MNAWKLKRKSNSLPRELALTFQLVLVQWKKEFPRQRMNENILIGVGGGRAGTKTQNEREYSQMLKSRLMKGYFGCIMKIE